MWSCLNAKWAVKVCMFELHLVLLLMSVYAIPVSRQTRSRSELDKKKGRLLGLITMLVSRSPQESAGQDR